MTSTKAQRLPAIGRGLVRAPNGFPRLEPLLQQCPKPQTAGSAGGGESVRGGGSAGGGERRTLPGVGTFLIDTPSDPGLVLRSRFLSYQEQHRRVLVSAQEEALPEIPFRLHPRPDPAEAGTATMSSGHRRSSSRSILKVDVATSPISFSRDEDSSQSASPGPPPSPAPPARSVSFSLDLEEAPSYYRAVVTANNDGRGGRVKSLASTAAGTKDSYPRGVSKKSPRSVASQDHGVSRKHVYQRYARECSKLTLYHISSAELAPESSHPGHTTERFPGWRPSDCPNPALLNSRKKSSSLSDLADLGSASYFFGQGSLEFHVRPPRPLDTRCSDSHVGPTSSLSFLHLGQKSKSLLDLVKSSVGEDGKLSDLSAYHKRQRIAHHAFRKESMARQSTGLSLEDADKEWLDVINSPSKVVDHTEYDKFASRRKPTTTTTTSTKSSASKKAGPKPFTPKSGVNFKLAQPASGKVYPVFFNDGLPVRKFGRATYCKRRSTKSKS